MGQTLIIRAFIYSNGKMKNLGALGGIDSIGNDINNNGQVVGWYAGKNYWGYYRHAFVYRNNKMADLNNLIDPNSDWVLYGVTSINDAGWIIRVSVSGRIRLLIGNQNLF